MVTVLMTAPIAAADHGPESDWVELTTYQLGGSLLGGLLGSGPDAVVCHGSFTLIFNFVRQCTGGARFDLTEFACDGTECRVAPQNGTFGVHVNEANAFGLFTTDVPATVYIFNETGVLLLEQSFVRSTGVLPLPSNNATEAVVVLDTFSASRGTIAFSIHQH